MPADDYILPPCPDVPVPEGLELLTAVPEDADPRLHKIQTMENWARILTAASTELLRELWGKPGFRPADLRKATGMSPQGLRKRARPDYKEHVNERRRTQTPPSPAPGDST